jgi:hypothetical protein
MVTKKEIRTFKETGRYDIIHKWYYDPEIYKNGPYKTEVEYPEDYVWDGVVDKADMLSPSATPSKPGVTPSTPTVSKYPKDRDTSKDESIPISQRMFTHPEGHLIGYTRAKMLGLV